MVPSMLTNGEMRVPAPLHWRAGQARASLGSALHRHAAADKRVDQAIRKYICYPIKIALRRDATSCRTRHTISLARPMKNLLPRVDKKQFTTVKPFLVTPRTVSPTAEW